MRDVIVPLKTDRTMISTNFMTPFPYKRAVIIGVTSSGKSTLAENLAKRFGHHFIELDALHWEPHW